MRTLEYLSSLTLAPMFSVWILYDDESNSAQPLLRADIEDITAEEVALYEQNEELGYFIREEKTLIGKKLVLFTDRLEKAIAKRRMDKLCSDEERPAPYDRPSLQDVELDNRRMVKCTDIGIIRNGFHRNGEAFMMLPSIPATNSCYWLYQHLGAIGRRDLIKIRLDPLIHEPVETFNPMELRMQVYGTALDWERVKTLSTIEHTEFIPDVRSNRDIHKTDLFWKPVGDEIHFTCEELPKQEFIDQRGSRYFHAIFQKQTGNIKHCDGAIRFFTEDEYVQRLAWHIKSNEVTRIGKRIKVFQVDVPKEEVEQEPVKHRDFVNLVTSFFVWNQDIRNYFCPRS